MVDNERVKQIVKEAASLPEEERRVFLDFACGKDPELRKEVEALLEKEGDQDQPTLQVEKKALKRRVQTFQVGHHPVPGEAPGEKIGPYELVEKLGEGGFGSVWMAQQREPIKRKVALKLIKLGMDTKEVIARFEAERQALALMDHPSIAKVIDAGSTRSGRPYFVMELVRGIPIDTYSDQNKLTMRERIALFIQVCNAIQHAHQKGIIHRDIKPSNVLVTLQDGKPLPKIIDFGIAKATHAELTQKTMHTRRGEMIGSPVYMSPEQAEMSGLDIDTRCDIYSLGVLLYELLTGTTPFDIKELKQKSLLEMLRVLREAEPETPSKRVLQLEERATETAARRQTKVKHIVLTLKGDLDWIILKCLEKDRTRRYETANGLAEDLERYLKHEPVIARPPSAVYKMRKFVRRNRAWVFAGTAIITVLILGIIGTTLGMIRATKALGELEEVTAFQENQLSKIDAAVMGERLRKDMLEKRKTTLEKRGIPREEITRELEGVEASLEGVNFTDVALKTLDENIFEEALRTIEKDFANRPKIQARLYQTVATTLMELGLLDRATAPQEKALEIRRRVLGDDDPDTLMSINNMGVLLKAQGKYNDAEPYLREALEGRRRILGNDHPDTLKSIYNMGEFFWAQGRYKEVEVYYREALEGRRRVLGNDHPDTLQSINNMGVLFYDQGKYKKAEVYYREALEGQRRVLGNDHPDTLGSINNMAGLFWAQGKYKEAEPYLREALEGRRRVLGNDHLATLGSINNMAGLFWAQGKYKEAEPYLREALEGRRRVLGNDHPDTLTSIDNMGVLLKAQGKYKEAEPYYREALEGRHRVLGNDHPNTLMSINNMGLLFLDQGKDKEAEALLKEALTGMEKALGPDNPTVAYILGNLAELYKKMGKKDEAKRLEERAKEIRLKNQ